MPQDSRMANSAASGTLSQSDSTTVRGWDGWPTPPTPEYLVPKMGDLPVSSTVQFQTIAMTSIGDGVSADMWVKLRSQLQQALLQKGKRITKLFVVTKAAYGKLVETATNVTGKVASVIQNNTLSISPTNEIFGNSNPNAVKSLHLQYTIGGIPGSKTASQNETIDLPGALIVLQASYGASFDLQDVTSLLAASTTNGKLSLKVTNDAFRPDPAPTSGNILSVSYLIDGIRFDKRLQQNDLLELPGPLVIGETIYSEMQLDNPIDVTQKVSTLVNDGTLTIGATNDAMGSDPAPNVIKGLRVDYTFNGIAASKLVRERETLTLGEGMEPVDGSSLRRRFFEPAAESVAELAGRFTNAGLKPTDFNPNSLVFSMEDELNELLGIAPDDLLDPLNYAKADAMDVPAEGALLYHEQGWYARGIALGNLLHSVALAPGEVTQIAITNWNHATRSSSSESVSQQDSTREADQQNRTVTDVQASALQEHNSGQGSADSSSTSSSSADSSIKAEGKMGFMSASGTISGTSDSFGSSNTVSTAVTRSDGSKNLAMDSNQNINAITQRQAEASRTRRAAVVREVSQSENETLTTRVLANYNHMHALTVMYFEVIEIYNLKTRVVDADRLLFLPFQVRDVHDLIPRFRSILIGAARAAGKPAMAEAINNYKAGSSDQKTLESQTQQVGDAISEVTLKLGGIRTELVAASDRFAANRKSLNDTFTALSNQAAGSPFTAGAAKIQSIVVKGQLDAATASENAVMQPLNMRKGAAERELADLTERSRRLNSAKLFLQDLETTLNDHRLFFNQAVWLSLAPSEVLGLARRRNVFKGERIYEQIDPKAVAITGNYVAYRWGFDDPMERLTFKKRYVQPYVGDPDQELATVQANIAVATGGVFGEAVLGSGVSAEKIDLSRFWNWKDSMIPILPTSINPLTAVAPTVQNVSTEPGKLDESAAKFSPLQELPAAPNFGALAQTMQAKIFNDMSGQDLLKTLAQATTTAAASSEQNAAQIASANLKAGLNFMSDMASKAVSVAAAPETGGGSLLGGMLKSKDSGGTSLLGGVLNAGGGTAKGELLSKLTGGRGDVVGNLEKAVLGGGQSSGETPAKAGGANPVTAAGDHAGIPADQLEDIGPPETKN